MNTHMTPTFKYDNQQIETIKRTAQVKRYSDSFGVDKTQVKANKIRRSKYSENSENIKNEYEEGEVNNYQRSDFCNPLPTSEDYPSFNHQIKYVPTRREVDSLVIDNYLFQRVSAQTNKDGSIGWRCKDYRRQNRCQSTCRVGPDGILIRPPGPHNHPCVTDAELVFMKAKAAAKQRCRSENNLSVQNIFMEEMSKAIISSGMDISNIDLNVVPKFEANKRCLQIQRKIGLSQFFCSVDENSNDKNSYNSDEYSVESEVSNEPSSNDSMKSEPESLCTISESLCKTEPESVFSTHKFPAKIAAKRKSKGLNSIISGLWDSRINE